MLSAKVVAAQKRGAGDRDAFSSGCKICGLVLLKDPTLTVSFPFWPPLFEIPASPLLGNQDHVLVYGSALGEVRGVLKGSQVVTEDFQC